MCETFGAAFGSRSNESRYFLMGFAGSLNNHFTMHAQRPMMTINLSR